MSTIHFERQQDGPPKFCIEREADWLISVDHVRRKSPGYSKQYSELTSHVDHF